MDRSTLDEMTWKAEVGGFRFAECNLSNGASNAAETSEWTHHHAVLFYVLDGQVEEEVPGLGLQAAEARSLLYRPPGLSVRRRCGEARGVLIEIGPQRFESLASRGEIVQCAQLLRRPGLSLIADQLHRELSQVHDGSCALLALEGLSLELLSEWIRGAERARRRRSTPWIRDVLDILRSRFSESLAMEDIARAVDRHPAHLAKAFRRETRCTVGEYIRRLRVEFVARQARDSRQPFSIIASDAGFADQSHMTRTFKQYMGCTPTQWRHAAVASRPICDPLQKLETS